MAMKPVKKKPTPAPQTKRTPPQKVGRVVRAKLPKKPIVKPQEKETKQPQPIEQETSTDLLYVDAEGIHELGAFIDFLKWIAIPSPLRNPKYYKDFADLHGINENTLTRWKERPGFWDEVKRFSYQGVREESVDVVYQMAQKAKKGDAYAAKVFLQAVEELAENVRLDDRRGISDERVAQIGATVAAWSKKLRNKNADDDKTTS